MLHNFVIDNDDVNVDEEDLLFDFEDTVEGGEAAYAIAGEEQATDPLVSSSARRSMLVELIDADDQLSRPLQNRLRNDNNDNNN